ncbi:MAG: hypothetical protein ACK55I_29630, partial [bacterium]
LAHRHERLVAEGVAGGRAAARGDVGGEVAVGELGAGHVGQRVHAVDVVVVLRDFIRGVVVRVVEADPEVLGGDERQVRGRLDAADLVLRRAVVAAAKRAVLGVVAAAGEVGERLATALHRGGVGLADAGLGEVVVEDRDLEDLEGLEAGDVPVRGERVGTRLRAGVAGVRRHRVTEAGGVPLDLRGPARRLRGAGLGEELDHA